jgi:hypothetical protein
MKRLHSLSLLFVLAACGDNTADPSNDAGNSRAPAEIDFAKLANFPVDVVGIYHLSDRADAINLELRADRSFRWSQRGCEGTSSDTGRFKLTSPTRLMLLPEAGRASFRWSALQADQVSEARMELDSGRFFEPTGIGGQREQIWEPGGICPICDAASDSTGQAACDTLADPQRAR